MRFLKRLFLSKGIRRFLCVLIVIQFSAPESVNCKESSPLYTSPIFGKSLLLWIHDIPLLKVTERNKGNGAIFFLFSLRKITDHGTKDHGPTELMKKTKKKHSRGERIHDLVLFCKPDNQSAGFLEATCTEVPLGVRFVFPYCFSYETTYKKLQ